MLALDNGDKIQGDTTTASKVDFTINGVASNTITQLADGQLPNAIGDLYTSGAAGTVVASVTLVNTNTTSESINLYLLPSGGTARRLIPKDLSLAAAYSLVFDGQKMQVFDTNGNVQYAVSTAGAANAALSNLSGVAINASLISDTDNTDDLGSDAKQWKDLYVNGTAYIDNIEIASGETITGDGTDLTLASGAKIQLTATSDVEVPVNVGIILGDGAEKLESDNTDLTINSGGDINLTATADINVPANIGVTFGDDGEKIEGDGTDLTIASSGKLNLNSTGVIEASYQGIADNAVVTVDDADAADNDYAKFTANGLEGRSYSEVMGDLSGQAAAAFDLNDQNLTQVGTVECLGIWDDDTDTGIQVEESADEDIIRMDVAGVEAFKLSAVGELTLAKQSTAKAYLDNSSTDQIIPTGAVVYILFDAEAWDVQNEFATTRGSGTAEAGTSGTTLHDDGVFAGAAAGDSIWNTTDNTYTAIASVTSDDEVECTGSIFAEGETFTWYRARFTATEDGKYLVSSCILWDSATIVADKAYVFAIRVNGVSVAGANYQASVASKAMRPVWAGTLDLSANDYVQIAVYHDSGTNQDIMDEEASTNVTIAKVA